MKCPKCRESVLLCKQPIFHIRETGRLHFTKKAIEMGKRIDIVPGNEESAIYFCESCSFTGTGEEVFSYVVARHQEEGDEQARQSVGSTTP